jgi:6-phosphogluconolactonase (cycloisomerase 2 family)
MMLRTLSAAVLMLSIAASTARADAPGAVYALTNSPSGNAVVVYERGADGALTPAGSFPTGGLGTGAGLGSQGAVVVSDDHRLLFAVNAGNNSVSSFRIRPAGLELIATAPSGGSTPTSVAFRAGLLYVLNAGVPNNVSGLLVSANGELTPLAGSARLLSGASTSPAQVGFSDDGATLIVTERATNRIVTFPIGDDGLLGVPLFYASAGPTPFGFAVTKRNTLLVSEAGAGGGASTYQVEAEAVLVAKSSMLMTGQRAACWAIVTKNGRYGYVTNAGTGNISGFRFEADGTATLLNADGITATTGGNPTDMAMSHDGHYLYARVAATNQIAVFRINADGSLSPRPALTATAAGLAGLAGF